MKDITNTALNHNKRHDKTPTKSPSSNNSKYQQQNRISKPSPVSDTVTRKTLQKKVSRLELLDDSSFTSFPLAPPASNNCSTDQTPSKKFTVSHGSRSSNKHNIKLTPSRRVKDTDMMMQSPSEDCDASDSTFGEADEDSVTEPIILIEDYIKPKKTLGKNRKISVLDLKSSVNYQDSEYLSNANALLKNKQEEQQQQQGHDFLKPGIIYCGGTKSKSLSISTRASSLNTPKSSLLLTTNIQHDLQSISTNTSFSSFGTHTSHHSDHAMAQYQIPTMTATKKSQSQTPNKLKYNIEFIPNNFHNDLKYCIICDKPLYELSSLLNRSSAHKTGGKQAVHSEEEYNEIVCSACTDRYEKISKLIDNYDVENLSEQEDEDDDNYEGQTEVRPFGSTVASKVDGFSADLIKGLQSQLNEKASATALDSSDSRNVKEIQWLQEAKKKLRWRWRLTGLIPKFSG
ncbi:hypothetical protein WICPIJ_007875 [Wickerhamomyces pijperi]|uniref:Uncharacterized protein n=1 Tax=Wickerhamomyces pijperi TaxID=599730 RepID=A0A9P8Q102_WICPI|nr:hypothetical protein WICPIJ_007875 [Wickerhamomyces pijperi]